jgi:hypothetical protein
VLLEDLKVVIDKSKRHFNPKYRAKGELWFWVDSRVLPKGGGSVGR